MNNYRIIVKPQIDGEQLYLRLSAVNEGTAKKLALAKVGDDYKVVRVQLLGVQ